MPNVGPLEIAIVLIIVLIIFGPKRLPELGRSMGRGIREFRGNLSADGDSDDDDDRDSVAKKKAELEASRSSESVEGEPVDGEVVTENKG